MKISPDSPCVLLQISNIQISNLGRKTQHSKFKVQIFKCVSQLQMKNTKNLWDTSCSPRNGSTEFDTTVILVNWSLRFRFCCSKAAPEARPYRHLKQLQQHASCSFVELLHIQMARKTFHRQLPSPLADLEDNVEELCHCLCIQQHQQCLSL